MRPRFVVCVVGFVALIALIATWRLRVKSGQPLQSGAPHATQEPPTEERSPESHETNPHSFPRQSVLNNVLNKPLPPHPTVDLERIRSDEEYRHIVRHHQNIKSYLATPLRGTPLYESLLTILLENGYSLDVLHNLYHIIHASTKGPKGKIKNKIMGPNPITNNLGMAANKDMLKPLDRFVGISITSMTGVRDEPTLEKLIRIAWTNQSPLEYNRLLDPEQGERLLTDVDWMTEEQRRAAESYVGEPRPRFGAISPTAIRVHTSQPPPIGYRPLPPGKKTP
jgi:hypothetical protein